MPREKIKTSRNMLLDVAWGDIHSGGLQIGVVNDEIEADMFDPARGWFMQLNESELNHLAQTLRRVQKRIRRERKEAKRYRQK